MAGLDYCVQTVLALRLLLIHRLLVVEDHFLTIFSVIHQTICTDRTELWVTDITYIRIHEGWLFRGSTGPVLAAGYRQVNGFSRRP
jgi:hypothetical protein